MIHPHRALSRGILALAPLMLFACSPTPESDAPVASASAVAEMPASASSASFSSAIVTTGGDGSSVVFTVLTAADVESAALPGELGCHFSRRIYDQTGETAFPDTNLLIAKGNVANEPAFAIIKVGSYVERLAAPGGFNGMVKGANFTGRGHTVRISVTGEATGGGESPPSPATLTYDRADGARVVMQGDWTCGP